MMENNWRPEQGDVVEIWNLNKRDSLQREFISMTSEGKYLCWGEFKTQAFAWNNAKQIKKKPVYERRWKMLRDSMRGHTVETGNYYNQKDIDKKWKDSYKGRYTDVLIKE